MKAQEAYIFVKKKCVDLLNLAKGHKTFCVLSIGQKHFNFIKRI